MNSSIFRAYDIRGLAPEELDAVAAGRIGQAIGSIYKPKRVLIGHDMRRTSDEIETALIEGLRSQGADIVRIGLCSTPMFNYAVLIAEGAYDLGIMITASHNPKEYNGMKLALPNNLPIGLGSGLEKIRDIAISGLPILEATKHGSVSEDDSILERYCNDMWKASKLDGDFHGWNIAVDCGNGMNGLTMSKLKSKIAGADIYPLFWNLDGNFPNHEANPMKPETLKEMAEVVLRRECQFGAAFDGDGDRVGFIDESGAPIRGDLMTAILALEILRAKPGATILYDGRASRAVPEAIEKAGGKAVMMDKLGHSNIKRQMQASGASFAGEASMHYYFDFLHGCEATDLAFLMMLGMLKREGKKLSEIWLPLNKYFHTGEINYTVQDSNGTIEQIDKHFEGQGTRVTTDGLRIDFGNWWFSVRASNTEPYLRLNLEAENETEMKTRLAELEALIK